MHTQGTRARTIAKRVALLLPALAIALSLFAVAGVGTASAEPLLGPDPTGFNPGSGCVGSVINITGHEFYPSMTANFGANSTSVYNITIPIGDNDTAQVTVPAIAAGTYTLTLQDRYGTGTVGSFDVLPCALTYWGNWNLTALKAKISPAIKNSTTGTTVISGATTLVDPQGTQVADNSAKATFSLSVSGGCASLEGSSTATSTVNITWNPNSIEASTVSFTGFTAGSTGTSGVSFTFGGAGTSVSGSYAGDDSGASSSMTLTTKTSESALAAACASKKGLSKITFTSGQLELQ
jgi:hypothetical protein